MAVTPYRAADPLDRLWENLMGGSTGGYTAGASLIRAPATDVIESENEIRVVTELPGMDADDIEIDLENNVLTIRGEKSEERTESDDQGTYHLAERRYGRFSRSFILPRDVEAENIQAQFDNGVLTVRIPKSERARRRRIEIGGDTHQREERQVAVQSGTREQSGQRPRGGKQKEG